MKTFCNHVHSFMLVQHLKAKVSKPKETRRAKTLSSTDSLIRLKNHLVSIRIAESSSFNKPKAYLVQITEGTATMPITNIVGLITNIVGQQNLHGAMSRLNGDPPPGYKPCPSQRNRTWRPRSIHPPPHNFIRPPNSTLRHVHTKLDDQPSLDRHVSPLNH